MGSLDADMDKAELTIPVFPLPNVVLLPHTMLPLHIFEPRYKEMFADALEEDRPIGVGQLRPGWETDYYGNPPVFRTIGIGTIAWSRKLEDGRYDIVLEGVRRARILSEAPRGSYREARVELLDDFIPPEAMAEVDEACEALLPVFRRLVALLPETMEDVQPASWAEPSAGVLADVLARVLMDSPYDRQSMLAELDIRRRLQLIGVRIGTILNSDE